MNPNVLLVESHPDLRLAISEALAIAHYPCDAVASGTAALLRIREAQYERILVDVDSPIPMTALCEALAAEPRLLAKVVIISDHDGGAPEAMAGQPLLRKPFDAKELLSRLKSTTSPRAAASR